MCRDQEKEAKLADPSINQAGKKANGRARVVMCHDHEKEVKLAGPFVRTSLHAHQPSWKKVRKF